MRSAFRRLSRDRRGTAIIEFAIVAPVMMLVIMGLCDISYRAYAQALLDGAVQKAGRDSAIQGGGEQTSVLDAKVIRVVGAIARYATFSSTRFSYRTFLRVGPEKFTDTNNNNVRDPGECFEDVNGNKAWDSEPGDNGQGGASDVTVYTMTMTYPRLFPITAQMRWDAKQTISARTLLKNQPYATQTVGTVEAVCT